MRIHEDGTMKDFRGRTYKSAEEVNSARQALRLAIDGKLSINDVIQEHSATLIELLAAQEYGSAEAGRSALLNMK